MINGYTRFDDNVAPLRLQSAIPLTYPLLCALFDIIDSVYCANTALRSASKAAFALGYGVSFRPQEYLRLSRFVSLKYTANSSLSFFWWHDCYFSVCSPATYPPGLPTHFSTLLEFQKNDRRGKGGPKALARCDSVAPEYDCLCCLYFFLRQYPPQPHAPLLSGLGSQLSIDILRPLLNKLALKFGFNPAKMQMHSSVRSGALSALEMQPDEIKERQGGWTSTSGMLNYVSASLQHANSVTKLLHDPTLVPLKVTQMTYSTLSSTSVPAP